MSEITFPGGTPSPTGIPNVRYPDGSRTPPSGEKKFTLVVAQEEPKSPMDELAAKSEEIIQNMPSLHQQQQSAARNVTG